VRPRPAPSGGAPRPPPAGPSGRFFGRLELDQAALAIARAPAARTAPAAGGAGPGGPGRLPETGFKVLDHLGARHQVSQGGEMVERVEPEPLEEEAGRAIAHGMARAVLPPEVFDVTPFEQAADDAVNVHAPHGGELGPGDGLLVGDDG